MGARMSVRVVVCVVGLVEGLERAVGASGIREVSRSDHVVKLAETCSRRQSACIIRDSGPAVFSACVGADATPSRFKIEDARCKCAPTQRVGAAASIASCPDLRSGFREPDSFFADLTVLLNSTTWTGDGERRIHTDDIHEAARLGNARLWYEELDPRMGIGKNGSATALYTASPNISHATLTSIAEACRQSATPGDGHLDDWACRDLRMGLGFMSSPPCVRRAVIYEFLSDNMGPIVVRHPGFMATKIFTLGGFFCWGGGCKSFEPPPTRFHLNFHVSAESAEDDMSTHDICMDTRSCKLLYRDCVGVVPGLYYGQHGHFPHEILSMLILLSRHIPQGCKLLVADAKPFVKGYLDLLTYDLRRRLLILPMDFYVVARRIFLVAPSPNSCTPEDVKRQLLTASSLHLVRKSVSFERTAEEPTDIVVVDRGNRSRSHVEVDDLIHELRATFSNRVVRFKGSEPLPYQHRIFSKAAVVIGSNGAALANLLHCNPHHPALWNSKKKARLRIGVVELLGSWRHWMYFETASLLDMDYRAIAADLADGNRFSVRSHVVLKKILDAVDSWPVALRVKP